MKNEHDSQWKPQPFENVWFPVEDPTKDGGAIPAYGNIKAILDNGKLDVRVIEAESSLNGRIPYEGHAIISIDGCAPKKKEIYDRIRQANAEYKPLYPVQVEGYDLESKRSEYLGETQETVNDINEENHISYYDMYKILGGSFCYEFDDTQLTLIGYHDGKEVKLDFENMTEDMYEQLVSEETDIEYEDAMYILRGSKQYEFDQSELIVSDYFSGDKVKLNLDLMTEEMFEDLVCSEDELYDDFEDAINTMNTENGLSV